MNSDQKKSERALKEEEVLSFWKENKIFEKSLKKESPKGEFVFFEGPPTANGRPGIHHLEARAFKDAIPRYKTMQGYHVRRKGGWDTHGLPVELEVEKELGFTSKKQIEEYGIGKFNQKCRESVWKYKTEWEEFTNRIGYWLDLENPYITYDPKYVESLWWIIKKINDQGLLYKDYKVLPWCPRCGTALSSHELAQGYQDDKDLSITAKFELVDESNTFILAWTTTPWTLPGNVGLAVGEDIEYIKVKIENSFYILAKARVSSILKDQQHEVIKEFKGKDLVGKSYKPLFPYLANLLPETQKENLKNAYKIYSADFVTTEDGTGVVHTAVMYGQEDFELGTKVGLPKVHLVKEDGTFVQGTGFLEGRFVKEEVDGKPTLAVDIIKDLQDRNLYFSKEYYLHSYPHCWRCKTPVIYYARDSWYVAMSKLKKKLQSENEKINWEPNHIRDGRFGEWLEELKDWAFSRERYWGTPLPVWEAEDKSDRMVIGSYEELKKHIPEAKNTYTFLRHGESELNTQKLFSNAITGFPLTKKGREQVEDAVKKIKKPDIIFSSPVQRALETAKMAASHFGITESAIIIEEQIIERNIGTFNGQPAEKFNEWKKENYAYDKPFPGGESYLDIKKRCGNFLYECEKKYSGKSILIVGHGAFWETIPAVFEGANLERSEEIRKNTVLEYAMVKKLEFKPLPHNDNHELDPHKPYIDEVVLEKNGKKYHRVKEVVDVWFDSGSMPYAQDHYPFEEKKEFQPKGGLFKSQKGFPADYICEGMDQTRGWFYTLHAVSNLLGYGRAFKNVICFGLVLDEKGQKMSKSRGNTISPWEVIPKYGADVLRFWMYSVNSPGESKSFDEKTVVEVERKVFNLLENVVKFYELYTKDLDPHVGAYKSPNVLDQWILARLNQVIEISTEHLDNFRFLEPTRAIRDFIADLSQWYIRRSRDRFKNNTPPAKGENKRGSEFSDKQFALATTQFVLDTLAKLLAPFAPFIAEDVYRRVGGNLESVHLEEWPEVKGGRWKVEEILGNMEEVRKIVSQALELRDKAAIKVRQPLMQLKVVAKDLQDTFVELIKEEVNVKEIIFGDLFDLDTTITPELRAEGNARELIRAIQDLRKKANLQPDQKVTLHVETNEEGKKLVEQFKKEIQQTASLVGIEFGVVEGEVLAVEEMEFKMKI